MNKSDKRAVGSLYFLFLSKGLNVTTEEIEHFIDCVIEAAKLEIRDEVLAEIRAELGLTEE